MLSIVTITATIFDVTGATHYKLLENADGVSGFSQVGSDIAAGTQTVDHIVPLHKRVNASYILQSCNAAGCSDDNTIAISSTLTEAIGYFKPGNTGAGDNFGISVSLSDDGNTLAVGAELEDSATSGINTTPNDSGAADNSGAVYLY